jgi:hypothetical protein
MDILFLKSLINVSVHLVILYSHIYTCNFFVLKVVKYPVKRHYCSSKKTIIPLRFVKVFFKKNIFFPETACFYLFSKLAQSERRKKHIFIYTKEISHKKMPFPIWNGRWNFVDDFKKQVFLLFNGMDAKVYKCVEWLGT